MKKIGLMTWFSYDNYGSVLQAYALNEVISSKNNEVKIINYEPRNRKKTIFDLSFKYYINQLLEKISWKKNGYIKKNIEDKYSIFRKKYFTLTDKCDGYTDLKKVSENFDCVVCGSDQIWSPLAYDENYYLSFAESTKKIAYAPSFGVNQIKNKQLLARIIKIVNEFDTLSVREVVGRDILAQCNNKNIEVVLDPTLLLDSNDWKQKMEIRTNSKKYIFCYFLGKNIKYFKIAEKIAKKLNMELYVVPINKQSLNKKYNVLENCGPKEFVEYIYNASLVLTDSYHGMLFSLNFNKPFIIFKRFKDKKNSSQNSRIYNIIKKFKLENCLYNNSLKNIPNEKNMDFAYINKILKEERKKSISYLENSINCNDENCSISSKITKMCTGCGMCAAMCPKRCINVVKNEYGFLEYKINEKECINCGLCKKVCAQCRNESINIKNKRLFAGKSKKDSIVYKSSSGAIAYELCEYAIKQNFPVIGCTYDNNENIAKHIIVNNNEEIRKLSGSKYLQSYTVNAFEKIKDLERGMIIGTPCQIASVDNYLKLNKKRENFILVDLICHGVPTYNLWQKLITKIGEINNVNFRSKEKGWHKIILSLNNKKVSNNNFFNFFNQGLVYNRSCYECNYRSTSCADIRLGDFWGNKYLGDSLGMNMIITVTDKGKKVIKDLEKSKVFIKEESINDYFLFQQSKNTAIPIFYEDLMKDIKNEKISLKELNKKYCRNIVVDQKIRTMVYSFIKKYIIK